MVGTILQMLGHEVSDAKLKEIIEEVDADGMLFLYCYSYQKKSGTLKITVLNKIILGSGQLEFEEFVALAAGFLTEDEMDAEAMQQELREAFRLYDKEGNPGLDICDKIMQNIFLRSPFYQRTPVLLN